jgi:Excalibur calcium-binding domain.
MPADVPNALDWFERQLASLENKHEQLRDAFHLHAEQPVHVGFTDVLRDIQRNLDALQARWIQVGGSVIALLISILLAVLGVLWSLLHPATTQPTQQTRTTCASFISQAEAQAFYRANPLATFLDGDNDGIACEDSPPPFDRAPIRS